MEMTGDILLDMCKIVEFMCAISLHLRNALAESQQWFAGNFANQ
jgi:hypothetical protein